MATKNAGKAKKGANTKRFVECRDGSRYEIIREDAWGYWCDGTQFAKDYPGLAIIDVVEAEPIEESEEE